MNGAGTTPLFDVTLTERFLLNSYLKESSLDSALTVLFSGIFCGIWNAFSLMMQHVVHEQWTDDIMQSTYQRTIAALAGYSLPPFVRSPVVDGISIDSQYLNRLVRKNEMIRRAKPDAIRTTSYLWYYNELNRDKTSKRFDQFETDIQVIPY